MHGSDSGGHRTASCEAFHIGRHLTRAVIKWSEGKLHLWRDALCRQWLITIDISPWARYENLPPRPLDIFEDSDFWTPCYMTIQYLLVCTQNIGA